MRGKRVSSVRCTGISGSLNHRFEAPTSRRPGASDSMHRLVSSEHRTGRVVRHLERRAHVHGAQRRLQLLSPRVAACTREQNADAFKLRGGHLLRAVGVLSGVTVSRFFSISQVCLPCRNGTTSSVGSELPYGLVPGPRLRGASCARQTPGPSRVRGRASAAEWRYYAAASSLLWYNQGG